jgi:hypothetical protein
MAPPYWKNGSMLDVDEDPDSETDATLHTPAAGSEATMGRSEPASFSMTSRPGLYPFEDRMLVETLLVQVDGVVKVGSALPPVASIHA